MLIFVGSPVTNTHYIASPHGEIYGLDHTRERFEPEMVAKLRYEIIVVLVVFSKKYLKPLKVLP